MTDFFKSALGIISGGGPGGTENDFVGQIVELGNQKLRVKKVIAEGINSQFLTTQFFSFIQFTVYKISHRFDC